MKTSHHNPGIDARGLNRYEIIVPMSLITIIGRGHSGTRAISHTLSESGVFMGEQLNKSNDLIPAEDLYEACRVMARHVRHLGGLRWDFSKLHTMAIDPKFKRLVGSYLSSVLKSTAAHKGWKLPETTLIFPWIARMFPDIKYIYWIRDPRDGILGSHLTDNLADFGVPYEKTDDLWQRRAVSWKYQVEIVKATPQPHHWFICRFEDFVLDQDRTLRRLRKYLGFKLAKIPVKPEAVGRWKTIPEKPDFDFLREDLKEHGYVT
ncbi:MAG: sulfotransferase [Verrucomicrobia bacterium]|nr:sulfotransferase [Verrucomicrobiota bacterium]